MMFDRVENMQLCSSNGVLKLASSAVIPGDMILKEMRANLLVSIIYTLRSFLHR